MSKFIGDIGVDFDGTICEIDYPNIGPLKSGAKEALQKFRDLGYQIIIYSCRTSCWYPEEFLPADESVATAADRKNRRVYKGMVKFLDDNEIPYDLIDDGSMGKPSCKFYIDDKGVRFEDNWKQIEEFVERNTRGH